MCFCYVVGKKSSRLSNALYWGEYMRCFLGGGKIRCLLFSNSKVSMKSPSHPDVNIARRDVG